jgi:hypothetical protein
MSRRTQNSIDIFYKTLQMFDIPPQDIIDVVKATLVKDTAVTPAIVMRALRKCNHEYQYTTFIYNHLLGLPHIIPIPDHVKLELVERFKSVLIAFDKVNISNVKNGKPITSFFNFNFVLSKLIREVSEVPDKTQIVTQLAFNCDEKMKALENKWNRVMLERV